MTAPVFVDSNVLVYARDASEPEKQPRAIEWIDQLWKNRCGRLSTQVLHEFYVTVTMKLHPGLRREDAREDVQNLLAWKPVSLNPALIHRAWDIQDRHGLSFWDSLIVGAAQYAGCPYLLSEDLNAGQTFEDLTVINPFSTAFCDVDKERQA